MCYTNQREDVFKELNLIYFKDIFIICNIFIWDISEGYSNGVNEFIIEMCNLGINCVLRENHRVVLEYFGTQFISQWL